MYTVTQAVYPKARGGENLLLICVEGDEIPDLSIFKPKLPVGRQFVQQANSLEDALQMAAAAVEAWQNGAYADCRRCEVIGDKSRLPAPTTTGEDFFHIGR